MDLKTNDKITVLDRGASKLLHATVAEVATSTAVYRTDRDRGSLVSTEEGKHWVRGWTGRAVAALKRDLAAQKRAEQKAEAARNRARAVEDRKRWKAHEDHAVKAVQRSLRVIQRAKVPPALRGAALAALLAPPAMMPFTLYR